MEGELCLAGPGLAMGYLGDAELTAARFVELTIAGNVTRVYRSGDLVRRRVDGELEYIGRRDRQIKLRGFRIELSGIEAALLGDDAVAGAAVQVVGTGTRRRLVAFVAPASGGTLDPVTLRSRLVERLPNYMVPAKFVVLDALPLTETGKIDRGALIEPVDDEVGTAPEILDSHQREVIELWQRTLRVPNVSLDDDFFELGGNSLLAVELLTLIENRFGVSLRLSSLFDARTPRDFSAIVGANTVPVNDDPSKYVVKLRDGSTEHRTPLWLVHPAGGSLVLYEPMLSHLRVPRRIMGVEATGLDGIEAPMTDIDKMADHQLAAILSAQPEGPYRLVGYSVGGIIAVEVSRRLIDLGHTVEFLGAIEAGVPTGPRAPVSRKKKYGGFARRVDLWGAFRELANSIAERRTEASERRSNKGTIAEVHKRVLDGMIEAFYSFTPKPLEIAITLFFGDGLEDGDPLTGLVGLWRGVTTDGVNVRRSTGAHEGDTILRHPHAEALAAELEDELEIYDRKVGR